jgi:hypothetical protein
MITLQTINNADPDALLVFLRDRLRHEDVSGVLDACEALYHSVMTPPLEDCSCGWCCDKWGVRDALRWVLSSAVQRHVECRQSDDWSSCLCKIVAIRIANLARLLPNPQPMTYPPSNPRHSHEVDALAVLTGQVVPVPAQTHALRFYVDALMLVKGDGWFDWWLEDLKGNGWHRGSAPMIRGGRVLTSLADIYGSDGPATEVYDDGTIRCGPECPPLPEVSV